MGTDYTFACARVRGNERSLINKDKMLVMIDAKTMEDACKVLQEAGYGEGEVILPSAYEKALEAEKRAAKISEEAERKRLEALEAEKKAKEVARKKALEAMEAERKAREEAE